MLMDNHSSATAEFQPLAVGLPSAPGVRPLAPRRTVDAAPAPLLTGFSSPRSKPNLVRGEICLPRCCQKGCVYPARAGGIGECDHHHRESLDPAAYQSQQPSSLLLDQAKFGLPDEEPEDTRTQDRHRLALERTTFLLEETV